MGRKLDKLVGNSSSGSMGRKLDKLLGRTSKISKLKPFLGLATARLAVLKNQRRARWSQARGDVSELLKLGQQDSALFRV